MKNYSEYASWMAGKAQIYGADSDIYFQQLGEKLRSSNKPTNLAKAAYLDIYTELKQNPSMAQEIWQVLYEGGGKGVDIVDQEKSGNMVFQKRELLNDMFPAQLENLRHRNSHSHLVDMVWQSGIIKGNRASRSEVAEQLYKYYSVLDMGGSQKLVFPTRQLTEHNLTAEDLEDNLPLILKFFDKSGSNISPFPVNEFGDFISEEMGKPELIKKIVKEMRGDVGLSDGASMWTSFRKGEDGKSLEVNVTAGNWDTGAFHEVGVWGYMDKDGQHKPLIIPMEDVFAMVKASKMSHWLDAMNDPWEIGVALRRKIGLGLGQDTLKEKISKWYNKGRDYKKEDGTTSKRYWGSKDPNDWLSIPNWAIEVADPRGFEFENIIVPFYEKYGPKGMDLSDSEFENMWQKLLEEESITFEDRFMKWWVDEFTDLIAPPGGFKGRTSVKDPFN